ncbi:cell division protein SepF [Spiroplasma diminutum]|uniref:Cell division protein SepF n=1 Tax=Spiroplasma diminutum CUAS-1 TaxID=1276221 RepID=S5MK41_9MOLU|nr:cell division protein SepF [Spiroplasma diminutum]AGR42335.1 hypothetical protein SDIMI_v3c06310 [Spiroplasma diminutum CUAS-1]
MGLFNKKQDKHLELNDNKVDSIDNQNQFNNEFNEEHITHFFPQSYNDTKEIADCLIRFKNVTVKLTDIEKADKKRLIDFLTGVMYALDGDYKKIDAGVYYFWISN